DFLANIGKRRFVEEEQRDHFARDRHRLVEINIDQVNGIKERDRPLWIPWPRRISGIPIAWRSHPRHCPPRSSGGAGKLGHRCVSPISPNVAIVTMLVRAPLAACSRSFIRSTVRFAARSTESWVASSGAHYVPS